MTVVSAPIDYLRVMAWGIDESMIGHEIPGVEVVRPQFDKFSWVSDMEMLSYPERRFPLVWRKLRATTIAKTLQEKYAPWALAAVGAGMRVNRLRPVDAILASGNPFSGFISARILAQRLDVPYVLDYRDPWTFSPFTGEDTFPPGSVPTRAERWAINRASTILHVNQALRDEYARRYPSAADRMRVVRNGWDPEFLRIPPARPPDSTKDFNAIYMGTLTENVPLAEALEGWNQARGDLAVDGGTSRFELHGHLGFGHKQRDIVTDLIDQGGQSVTHEGPVPRTEVSQVYASADVLVFLAGGNEYVTGGKVYEYMATGLPIVSIHHPNIAAVEELSQYPLWFPAASLKPEDIAAAFRQAATSSRTSNSKDRERALSVAEHFTRESAISGFVGELQRLVDYGPTEKGHDSWQT